jgi:hypothetical protein
VIDKNWDANRIRRFTWRILLVSLCGQLVFYVTDPNIGRTHDVDASKYLSRLQTTSLGYLPDFRRSVRALSRDHNAAKGPKPLQVEARISVSSALAAACP